MSLEQLGSQSYALRNLWEATLSDEKHNPAPWTTALMVSTNIPKLRFAVEPILAGSSKGYKGWELPDSLSLVMRETSDHSLEKYLDKWMTGSEGVFNPGTGAFRIHTTPDSLYRKVVVRTFYYTYTSGEDIAVKVHEAIQRGAKEYIFQVSEKTEEVIGKPLSIKAQEYLRDQAYTIMTKEYAKGNYMFVRKQEIVAPNPVPFVEKKQVVPIVDKLTALTSGVVNQMASRVSLSDLTRAVMPPVVIPPPLLRVPVATGSPPPIPQWRLNRERLTAVNPSETSRQINLYDVLRKKRSKSTDLRFDRLNTIRKVAFDAVQSTEEKIVKITGGEAVNAKTWKAREVETSRVTYTCAIEGYDIGTYDYQTGEGVQYTISLPVCDIAIG
jgi:hypothetical protein